MRSRHPLCRPFSRRRRALEAQADLLLTGDTQAIHQARVASRRLRETLPLAQAVLDDDDVDQLQRRMRRLTRLLGPVRELDVTIGLAIEHRESLPAEAPALSLVESRLTHERDARYAKVVHDLRPDKLRKWLDRASEIEEKLASARDTKPWRVELAERLRTRARQLLAAVEDAGLLFTPDRLHEVRIAVKRLRYVLELTGELQLARTGSRVTELKAAQDILGHLHDLDILVLQVQAAAGDRPPAKVVRQALDAASLRLDKERRAAHAEYLAHRLKLANAADWVQDEAVRRVLSPRPPSRKTTSTKTTPAKTASSKTASRRAVSTRRAPGGAAPSASAANAAPPTRRPAAASASRSTRRRPS
jgi:CHAD domain-containing protein